MSDVSIASSFIALMVDSAKALDASTMVPGAPTMKYGVRPQSAGRLNLHRTALVAARWSAPAHSRKRSLRPQRWQFQLSPSAPLRAT